LDSSYFLELAITSFGSHFDEALFVAFHDEAAAVRKMNNFAQPQQTFDVTPGVRMREAAIIFKRYYPRKFLSTEYTILSTKLNITIVISLSREIIRKLMKFA
jgi:hypothetical protein